MSNVDASDVDGDDVERPLVDTQARPGLDGLDDFQDEDVMLAAKVANCITPSATAATLSAAAVPGFLMHLLAAVAWRRCLRRIQLSRYLRRRRLHRSCSSPSMACAPGQFPVARCAYGHPSDCSCVRFRPCTALGVGCVARAPNEVEVVPHCCSRSRPVPVLSPPSWCCLVGWFVGSLVVWLVA